MTLTTEPLNIYESSVTKTEVNIEVTDQCIEMLQYVMFCPLHQILLK
jgi:hypothetical protein